MPAAHAAAHAAHHAAVKRRLIPAILVPDQIHDHPAEHHHAHRRGHGAAAAAAAHAAAAHAAAHATAAHAATAHAAAHATAAHAATAHAAAHAAATHTAAHTATATSHATELARRPAGDQSGGKYYPQLLVSSIRDRDDHPTIPRSLRVDRETTGLHPVQEIDVFDILRIRGVTARGSVRVGLVADDGLRFIGGGPSGSHHRPEISDRGGTEKPMEKIPSHDHLLYPGETSQNGGEGTSSTQDLSRRHPTRETESEEEDELNRGRA